MIFRFFLLKLMKWKPLLKMKWVANLSLGIKVWDILFYLPEDFDAGVSSSNIFGSMLFMVSDVLETHWGTFLPDFIEIGWIELKFEQFLPYYWNYIFLVFGYLLQSM